MLALFWDLNHGPLDPDAGSLPTELQNTTNGPWFISDPPENCQVQGQVQIPEQSQHCYFHLLFNHSSKGLH